MTKIISINFVRYLRARAVRNTLKIWETYVTNPEKFYRILPQFYSKAKKTNEEKKGKLFFMKIA